MRVVEVWFRRLIGPNWASTLCSLAAAGGALAAFCGASLPWTSISLPIVGVGALDLNLMTLHDPPLVVIHLGLDPLWGFGAVLVALGAALVSLRWPILRRSGAVVTAIALVIVIGVAVLLDLDRANFRAGGLAPIAATPLLLTIGGALVGLAASLALLRVKYVPYGGQAGADLMQTGVTRRVRGS